MVWESWTGFDWQLVVRWGEEANAKTQRRKEAKKLLEGR